MLPATQKTEELVGGVHPSGTVEPLRAASGEGPKDAQMEGNAQLSCSVKEEPDGYVQETGEVRVYEGWGPLRVQRGESRRGCAETGGSWSGSGVPSWEAGPTRTGSPGGWREGLAAYLPCAWHTKSTPPAARGGPRLQHQCQLLACPGSQGQSLTPACLAS